MQIFKFKMFDWILVNARWNFPHQDNKLTMNRLDVWTKWINTTEMLWTEFKMPNEPMFDLNAQEDGWWKWNNHSEGSNSTFTLSTNAIKCGNTSKPSQKSLKIIVEPVESWGQITITDYHNAGTYTVDPRNGNGNSKATAKGNMMNFSLI